MKYCCQSMERNIEREKMKYDKIRGSFMFYVKDERSKDPVTYNMSICVYCPYCGTKLPKDLIASDDYFDELEKALGKELCDIKDDEIPEEFESDEWWRKRNIVMYEEPHKSKLYEENIEIINGERVLKVY